MVGGILRADLPIEGQPEIEGRQGQVELSGQLANMWLHQTAATVFSLLGELRIPSRNRLEALSGDRKGQFSIRIDEQCRVCFVWTEDGPDAVEIVDYH